jgi:hypothetical protein
MKFQVKQGIVIQMSIFYNLILNLHNNLEIIKKVELKKKKFQPILIKIQSLLFKKITKIIKIYKNVVL